MRRELAVALALSSLVLLVATRGPALFGDLAPLLIVASAMAPEILAGQIHICVGAHLALGHAA